MWQKKVTKIKDIFLVMPPLKLQLMPRQFTRMLVHKAILNVVNVVNIKYPLVVISGDLESYWSSQIDQRIGNHKGLGYSARLFWNQRGGEQDAYNEIFFTKMVKDNFFWAIPQKHQSFWATLSHFQSVYTGFRIYGLQIFSPFGYMVNLWLVLIFLY